MTYTEMKRRAESIDARLAAIWQRRGAVETIRRTDGTLYECDTYAKWQAEVARYERETGRTPPDGWIVARRFAPGMEV